jgi:hypothetical protein
MNEIIADLKMIPHFVERMRVVPRQIHGAGKSCGVQPLQR